MKQELETIFTDSQYKVELEYNVNSMNSTGKKRCDIVVLKNKEPYIVFPVKIIMTNYKQNKNNGWENLTGELLHILWANPDIKIIPINIFMDKTPYLTSSKLVTKFETITIEDIQNYNILKEKKCAYDIINYIIDVEHQITLNEAFAKMPKLIAFNSNTPFRNLNDILADLI